MKFTKLIAIIFAVQMVPALAAAIFHDWLALGYVMASAVSAWVVGLVLAFHIHEKGLAQGRK